MKIIEYNYDTRIEYSRFIKKYNKSKWLDTFFSKGKKIFLIVEKGFLKKYKIIGYSIIYEDLHVICFSNVLSEKYDVDTNTIFIADFMIDIFISKSRDWTDLG